MNRHLRALCARGSLAALALLLCGALPAKASAVTCTATVSSVSAAESAVASASPGDAVCLTDGSYGRVSLSATKSTPGVTLQAQHPGDATINGVDMDGSHLTAANLEITGSVVVATSSVGMTIDHNLIVGNRTDYGVFVCPASPPDHCDDVSITGNIFDGSFDEDTIRANVYHDADSDGNGLLVEDNEFRGNQEFGGHNDIFQSVWVGDHLVVRGNYMHDFGGQGLLVKDQGSAIDGFVADNNLIIRQNLPCDPDSLCPTWQLSPFQIFGPISNGSISHNTIWPTDPAATKGGGASYLRDSGWSSTTVSDNVIDDGGMDATTPTGTNNTRCTSGGGWSAWPGTTTDCSPAFLDTANDDYRQTNGRGVDWKPSDKQFGPAASPPVDHTPTAAFTFSPTAPQTGDQVSFDATTSTCQDTPCTYAWTDEPPGGGVWTLGSGSTLNYTFTGAGTKYVTLRVTDADGDVDTVEHNVVVSVHTTLLGNTSNNTNDDYNPDGTAEAFQFTASASGTVTHLWVKVVSGFTATSLKLGLYRNTATGNHPQTLLTSGSATPVAGWNDITVPSASVASGTKYWIAVLGTGGIIKFRDGSTSNGRAEGSLQTNLTTLPSTWSTGTNWPGSWPLSGYATT
jgi:PKD domain-containing protein